MREPTYLIVVALTSMLVASPFSAFAQQEPVRTPPIVNLPIVNLPIVNPPIVNLPCQSSKRDGPPAAPQGGRADVIAARPSPQQPKHSFYYHRVLRDLKGGVPYDTMEDCAKARRLTGDVGVCVMK
jgi:hypothetical protein